MTSLKLLIWLLKLAAFFARQANQREVEEAVLNEVKILNGERVRDSVIARDDVLSGRVPPDPKDPYLRD